nr:prepilin-type N-terminal cleavage/methylation domain-containing protein [Allomuricauda sp.]
MKSNRSFRNHRIKAFTLNEMMVVLVITSIVIGIGFSVLRLVQKQMDSLGTVYGKNTEINLLRQSLWIDFNTSDGAWYDTKTNELVFANGIKSSRYQWYDSYVVKERDTFFLEVDTIEYYFNGLYQASGEVDAMDISCGKKTGGHRIVVYKKNAATSYLN